MMKLGRLLLRIRARLVGALSPGKFDEVRQAVDRDGRWEEHVEWRISTVTSTLIERTGERGYRKYHVRVECDYVFEAHCPTLARACGRSSAGPAGPAGASLTPTVMQSNNAVEQTAGSHTLAAAAHRER